MDSSRQVMSGGEGEIAGEETRDEDGAALFEPLREVFSRADEPQRYRLLASLLEELANRARSGEVSGAGSPDRIETLVKKNHTLQEEKAVLNDTLAALKADLAHQETLLVSEQKRSKELQRIVDDQRERMEALRKEHEQTEVELVARNAELHRAQVDNEEMTLRLQRAERDASGQDRINAAEQENRGLLEEITQLRAEADQLRADKDAKIERLHEDVRVSTGAVSEGPDQLLSQLWQRLASARPPLSEGHIQPTVQAAERMVDTCIELVRFADDFDKGMRVFLAKYTRHHPSVKVPWEVYARRDDVRKTAQQAIAPQEGRPVGLLKMRLRFLYSWTQAAMLGCDSAIESIASELRTQLMGPEVAGSDPTIKVKEYLRRDGPELFLQHIRELLSQKLAESYGRVG